MDPATLKKINRFPDAPGIYLFFNSKKELIYVGKATSLKQRVKSYFRGARTPRPIEEMIHEVSDIKYKETDSVLEAVILESIYIKKFQPKYNVLGKDDRSWNYIVITKDLFPRVETIRQHEYQQNKFENKYYKVFGPYPGLNIKETLKLLRKMFRYSTCKPNQGRPCLYREIGQCLGVCTGEISSAEYKKQVIRPLALFLSGKKQAVIRIFEREMRAASKGEQFERAAQLRDQLKSLQRIHDVVLINNSFFTDPEQPSHTVVNRIEGYDISNLGAMEKVGSMVVFDSSGPVKSEYRKFIVKTVVGQSDVDSLTEVLRRRLKHSEWPLPQLFLIDGGRPQVHRAVAVIKASGLHTPVVGIAKGRERKRNDFILGATARPLIPWVSGHQKLLIKVRDEAHRFAIKFHRERRSKSMV